jgi:hypothetical protein
VSTFSGEDQVQTCKISALNKKVKIDSITEYEVVRLKLQMLLLPWVCRECSLFRNIIFYFRNIDVALIAAGFSLRNKYKEARPWNSSGFTPGETGLRVE